jgi:hypothetical protein
MLKLLHLNPKKAIWARYETIEEYVEAVNKYKLKNLYKTLPPPE